MGLRVLHRTTIKGTVPPRKHYQIDEDGNVVGAAAAAAHAANGAGAAGEGGGG